MKYMLMMNAPGKTPYQIFSWAKSDIEAHIAFMRNFAQKLSSNGELVSAEGLAGPDQAKLVRGGTNGEAVTDGVFPRRRSSSWVTGSSMWTRRSVPTPWQRKRRWRPVRTALRCACPSRCGR